MVVAYFRTFYLCFTLLACDTGLNNVNWCASRSLFSIIYKRISNAAEEWRMKRLYFSFQGWSQLFTTKWHCCGSKHGCHWLLCIEEWPVSHRTEHGTNAWRQHCLASATESDPRESELSWSTTISKRERRRTRTGNTFNNCFGTGQPEYKGTLTFAGFLNGGQSFSVNSSGRFPMNSRQADRHPAKRHRRC